MRSLFFLGVVVWHMTNSNGFVYEDKYLDMKQVIHSTGGYSNKLLKAIAEDISSNVIFSPISGLMVLSMASYGARGHTKYVMRSALEFPLEDRYAEFGFEYINSQISVSKNIKGVGFHLANAIFLNDEFTAKIPFTKVINETFHSILQYVNFTNEPLATRAINTWCSEQTNNTINKLIEPNQLQNDTEMILLDAAYFKGYWIEEFDPKLTKLRPFFVEGNTTKKVPTMSQFSTYVYGELSELDARYIKLPYKSDNEHNDVSMYIILPKKRNGIASLIQNINRLNFETLFRDRRNRFVQLRMPKFSIETKINLAKPLSKLHMGMIFNNTADFGNIRDKPVWVNTMIQKAHIEVNEMGIQATASAGRVLGFSSILNEFGSIDFIVDHPFISIITGGGVPFLSAVILDPSI